VEFTRRHRVAVTAGTALLLVAASSALLYQVHLRKQEKAKEVAGLAQVVEQARHETPRWFRPWGNRRGA
jgi:hypothetical protein